MGSGGIDAYAARQFGRRHFLHEHALRGRRTTDVSGAAEQDGILLHAKDITLDRREKERSIPHLGAATPAAML
jgi:hypothetical protein